MGFKDLKKIVRLRGDSNGLANFTNGIEKGRKGKVRADSNLFIILMKKEDLHFNPWWENSNWW